ncbi:MAG: zinc-binding dehydrogenase [Deltaproteobacteria bacterium]|nr:zinc-binding dehydrogenase [Deltaproteobacteria bacterium]
MKAIFIERIGLPADALRVRDCPSPAVGPGQVKIRVSAFGVNFADVLARTGMYMDAPRLPFIPGYEVAGIVVEVGDGCKRIRPGQRVAAMTDFGGYAQEAVAQEGAVVEIPGDMEWATAAAIPVNGVTALLALKGLTNIFKGDRVLIHAAAGGVGLMAVQMALDEGCEVFGTVSSEKKAEFLRAMGVQHPLIHSRVDVETEIRRITNDQGLDLVLDSLGGSSISAGMRMLAPSGRLVSIGIASMTPRKTRNLVSAGFGLLKTPFFHPYSLLSDSKSYIGINIKRIAEKRPAVLARAFNDCFTLLEQGRIKPHLDSVFAFEDCWKAHERLHGRKSIGKVVVAFGEGEEAAG